MINLQAYELNFRWKLLAPDRDEILLYILHRLNALGYKRVEESKLHKLIYDLKSRLKMPIKYKFSNHLNPRSDNMSLDLLDLLSCGYVNGSLDLEKGLIYEITSFGRYYVKSLVSPRLDVFEKYVIDGIKKLL